MEMGKRSEAVDGEIHLHEAIIQHIQSFLSRKEAAQTSILCKSWYNAWATRPIVDLDQRHFQIRGYADRETVTTDGFLDSSKKIMRRYEESNLKIECFRFCLENIETDCFSIVNELIVDAMKLGACDLHFGIIQGTAEFYLPHQVLRSDNLVCLFVSDCRIDLEATGGKVGFSKLKSLSLCRVCIVGFSTFDIASNCPLIENLVLSECTTVPISNGNTVETIKFVLGSFADARIHPYDNLKSLYLEMIVIDRFLFIKMSRSFPCLKDLTVNQCKGFRGILLYSPSLEFLNITHTTVMGAKFYVPCLRKFTYFGTSFTRLSFKDTSMEWESDISLILQERLTDYSLDMLNNFLMQLRLSKISVSLFLGILSVHRIDHVEPAPCLPEVENLMLSMHYPTLVCSLLLKSVFCTCRPKFITQDWLPQLSIGREENCDLLKLLCKTLIDEQSKSCCIPSRHMSDLYGLEKVDVEVFEDGLAEWQPLPWKALVDASESPEKRRKNPLQIELGTKSFFTVRRSDFCWDCCSLHHHTILEFTYVIITFTVEK